MDFMPMDFNSDICRLANPARKTSVVSLSICELFWTNTDTDTEWTHKTKPIKILLRNIQLI